MIVYQTPSKQSDNFDFVLFHFFNLFLLLVFFLGGILCFTCRLDAFESEEYGFKAKFDQLERSKRWQLISNTLTDYYVHPEAQEFSHSKCHMLVYKVLSS